MEVGEEGKAMSTPRLDGLQPSPEVPEDPEPEAAVETGAQNPPSPGEWDPPIRKGQLLSPDIPQPQFTCHSVPKDPSDLFPKFQEAE